MRKIMRQRTPSHLDIEYLAAIPSFACHSARLISTAVYLILINQDPDSVANGPKLTFQGGGWPLNASNAWMSDLVVPAAHPGTLTYSCYLSGWKSHVQFAS
ncbi:hypothetical protein FRC08_000382 [Ceratobasidium sp. 394]|nr:hypothetical protein FRC08_000382 [Ceratobasidium sp. 394]